MLILCFGLLTLIRIERKRAFKKCELIFSFGFIFRVGVLKKCSSFNSKAKSKEELLASLPGVATEGEEELKGFEASPSPRFA